VPADPANLHLLRAALNDLQAVPIAVPDFHAEHLRRGHVIHFRCRREDVSGLRIDLMSSLRGVADLQELWERRTTIKVEGNPVDMLSLPNLVKAKKTQRDKDWPMISRLVGQSCFAGATSQAAMGF
jgi:hypothetical protein